MLTDVNDSFPPSSGFPHLAEPVQARDERRYVLVPRDLLLQILSAAARGDRLDPRVHAAALACVDPTARGPRRSALTRRELEVLERLAAGLSYKQIGSDLHISIDTVRTYVRTLYRKLGAHSVTEAIASARQLGLVGAPGTKVSPAAPAAPAAATSRDDDDIRLF